MRRRGSNIEHIEQMKRAAEFNSLRREHASAELTEARRSLLSEDAVATSLAEVAMRVGFRELGRFAVDPQAIRCDSVGDAAPPNDVPEVLSR